VPRFRAKEYMDEFVNPDDYVEQQKKKKAEEEAKQQRFPRHPERDVLLFLMEHAPLQKWQRNVVGIIRDEAYYFAPQGMTKIMNEGWASYWHSTLMTRYILPAGDGNEFIDYADRHAGTMAMSKGRLNPYKIGLELFRHIEDRWNKGQFGKAWDDCDDMAERAQWDKKLGLGRDKIFEVRKLYNDVTFLDEFLTPEFCAEQKLFTFSHNRKADEWQIASREFKAIKQKLLFQLTNQGQPVIEVVDGNFENKNELLLRHLHEGVDLHDEYARETLTNLHRIWKRPVHVATTRKGKGVLVSFDGQKHGERAFDVLV
jgi:stage V sporulation protein R